MTGSLDIMAALAKTQNFPESLTLDERVYQMMQDFCHVSRKNILVLVLALLGWGTIM